MIASVTRTTTMLPSSNGLVSDASDDRGSFRREVASRKTSTSVCMAMPPRRLPVASPRSPLSAAEAVIASSGREPARPSRSRPPTASPSPNRSSRTSVAFERKLPTTPGRRGRHGEDREQLCQAHGTRSTTRVSPSRPTIRTVSSTAAPCRSERPRSLVEPNLATGLACPDDDGFTVDERLGADDLPTLLHRPIPADQLEDPQGDDDDEPDEVPRVREHEQEDEREDDQDAGKPSAIALATRVGLRPVRTGVRRAPSA